MIESGNKRMLRMALALSLLLLFFGLAWLLFNRQQAKYTFRSFQVPNEKLGVLVPNPDRLFSKISSTDQLKISGLPLLLAAGLDYLLGYNPVDMDPVAPYGLYVSASDQDFSIAIQNSELSSSAIVEWLKSELDVDASADTEKLLIGEHAFYVSEYAQFMTISTLPVVPAKMTESFEFGNSDFIVFSPTGNAETRHQLYGDYHQTIWSDSVGSIKGDAVYHHTFLRLVTSTFSQIQFFGSSQFQTDQSGFFTNPQERAFNWIDQGMVLIQKDSFELLIAPQNLEYDLALELEDQTLQLRGDSASIQKFNIGPYTIMPFESDLRWKGVLPSLNSEYGYFTSIDNFNILANSVPAMRWYLGEIQLGNLILKSPLMLEYLSQAIPQRVHAFKLIREPDGSLSSYTETWSAEGKHLLTSCVASSAGVKSSTGVKLVNQFDLAIIPEKMQLARVGDSALLILNNKNQVFAYDTNGSVKWSLTLSSKLMNDPQIIDLEQDGEAEIALFQQNQLDVIDAQGHSQPGFPLKFALPSGGGIAVNYDNAYNYRFLVSTGNQVKSIDESGQAVQGWMFTTMTAELKGSISYYVTQGKDMISFKDMNNSQYVINRRGESRLTKVSKVNLPNESPFVVGAYEESSLRKLGYRNNHILNYYLFDAQLDSVKIDKPVQAISAFWIFNENQPLLVIEEVERVVVMDEFGYEKESVLKPEPNQSFAGLVIEDAFSYVFADNSENSLYLLDGFGKMIFAEPVNGSSVYCLENNLLFTVAGTKVKVYKTD